MTFLDFFVEFLGGMFDDKNRRSNRIADGADVASWVLGPLLGILFLIWLGSGGGGPLAVGFRLMVVISVVVQVGSVVLLLLLVYSAFNHPADTLVRKVARLVLLLGIVCFWLLQWADSRPTRRHAASRPVPTSTRPIDRPTTSREMQGLIDEAERQRLVTQVSNLRKQIRARWRADIEAAGATGAPGVAPPMLEVRNEGRGVWRVTNRHSQWIALRMARVVRPAGASTAWTRCVLDESTPFLEIVAGGTRKFVLEAGCPGSLPEFRVGDAARPEPSWWTSTALDAFDDGGAQIDAGHEHWNATQLKDEIGALEQTLAETDRAARWRRELTRQDTRVEAP